MKLAKALKLRNQLAGEVAELKRLLATQNVRSTKQKFDYDAPLLRARRSVNTKQPERPLFQGGPSRCESGHGDHWLTSYVLRRTSRARPASHVKRNA